MLSLIPLDFYVPSYALALCPRAAAHLSISKRTLSRLIAARKDGVRTLVDVASLKAYYAALPLKTDPRVSQMFELKRPN